MVFLFSSRKLSSVATYLCFAPLYLNLFAQDLSSDRFPIAPASPLKNNSNLILRSAFANYFNSNYSQASEKFKQYFSHSHTRINTEKQENKSTGAYAHSVHSITLAQMKRFDEALREIKKARKLYPQSVDYVLLQTEILKKSGNQRAALNFIEGFQYKLEDQPGIEFYLAELKFHLGMHHQAQIHYLQTLFHIDLADSRSTTYRRISLWRMVHLHFEKKDYQGAEKYLKEYISLEKENGYARFMLADFVYFQGGKYEEAFEELQILSSYGPEHFQKTNVPYVKIRRRITSLLLQLYFFFKHPNFHNLASLTSNLNDIENALVHTSQNANETSIRFLEAAAKKHPHSAYILSNAIWHTYKKTHLIPADLTYSRFLKQTAILSLKYKRYRSGLKALNEILQLPTDQSQEKEDNSIYLLYAAHYKLYKQYHRSAFFIAKALKIMNQYQIDNLRLNSDNQTIVEDTTQSITTRYLPTYFVYVDLLSKFNPKRALQVLNKLAITYPKNPIIYSLRGKIYLRQNFYTQALEAFNYSIELFNDSTKAKSNSINKLKTSTILQRNNLENYFFRTYINLQLRDYQVAKQDLHVLLQANKNNPLARNMKAYTLAVQNIDLNNAIDLILPVVQQYPKRGDFHDTIGWVYFKLKNFPYARYHLQLAANLLKDHSKPKAEILEHLGDVYSAMKRFDRAIASYKEAMYTLNIVENKHLKILGSQYNTNTNADKKAKQQLNNKIKKLQKKLSLTS